MNITENISPACNESNVLEAVVCRNCGAALDDPFIDPGFKTKRTDTPTVSNSIRDWPVDEAATTDHGIAIYIEGEFKPAYVDSRGEFVIGRRAEPTLELPEDLLDLSPLGGYAQGLSRRHAVIRRSEDGYKIMELGSVNGNWLTDERMVPHKYYLLASNSHLRLGSMRLFVLYRPQAETKQKP